MNKLASQFAATTGARAAGVHLRVVGCGNPWAGDDGAGVEVVRRVRDCGRHACELLERPQAGVELMQLLEGAETVVFVDAVSSGAPAGTLHLLSLPSTEVESRGLGSLSSHGWGVAELLGLMKALGRPTPRLYLVGIEIGSAVPGASRSAAVEQAIRLVVERFPALCSLLAAGGDLVERLPRRFEPADESFPGDRGESPAGEGGL